ncbi:replication initiator [Corynebacterium variabile]|uniref:replication initiator n=1 Tax=Corynebacterium variabile TaxID=1727 RepID=UPI002FE081B0
MSLVPVTPEMARAAAEHDGVCIRPQVRTVTDRVTGSTTRVMIRCGSTRESQCPPCAERSRKLRVHQCLAGWHVDTEPETGEPGDGDVTDDAGHEAEPATDGDHPTRVVRSTRRRRDVDDLPRVHMDPRTVGAVFPGRDGRTYRPSMFVTLTLGSYGATVPGQGVPRDPSTYDYRRAALDALHFSKLMDRFFQNVRRCCGFNAQYFAAVESQLRLALHAHIAIRGAIPRAILRQVIGATYHQVWWPPHETPVYVDRHPIWTDDGYCDPGTGEFLPTWEEAMAALDEEDAEPAHVMRFGSVFDIQGIDGDTDDARRSARYLTKYLTKSLSTTYVDPDQPDNAYEAHIDRLHHEVRYLPCSESCSNWLRFGIQPKDAEADMFAGHCPAKAHDRENLGHGGRRILVSRKWSGKTLKQHRAERADIVRAVLEEAGITPPDAQRMAAETLAEDGQPRFIWEDAEVSLEDYANVLTAAVLEKRRWRAEYERAKELRDRASPDSARSATPPTLTA